jgi:hypothetical protein
VIRKTPPSAFSALQKATGRGERERASKNIDLALPVCFFLKANVNQQKGVGEIQFSFAGESWYAL